jgi:GABA permease
MTILLREAENTDHSARGEPSPEAATARRVLIVIDEPCTSPELCTSLRTYADQRPLDALVIAPAHESAATQWYVDDDAARADATYRLRGCVACLRRDGIRVEGQLGDRDPVLAIADALNEFPADEILFVTRPQRPSRWLRPNVIDRARRTFAQPIKHVSSKPQPNRGLSPNPTRADGGGRA